MFDLDVFYEAKNVDDAVSALVKYENAEVISGGTDVLIRVREGKDAGRSLVSIQRIPEIVGVELRENGDLWIGSATNFHDITHNELIRRLVPMLGEAVDQVGGPQIRNVATIGGNICNGATSADSAASMTAYDAIVLLAGPNGRREVPITSFYTGPGRTVRDRCEVCTGFIIKKENYENHFGRYYKYGKRRSMEIATLGCSVVLAFAAGTEEICDCRIAYGVAAPTPIRCRRAEQYLVGKKGSDGTAVEEAVKLALSEVNPRTSWRASKEFRLQLISELLRRGITEVTALGRGENYA